MEVTLSKLRDTLDQIDAETVKKGKDKLEALWIIEKTGMWRKGVEILKAYPGLANSKPRSGGRGVSEVSFVTVSQEVGRTDKTIAAWVKLALAYPKEGLFLEYAKVEATQATARWEAGLLPPPKPPRPELPDRKYRVIYADPPWAYGDKLIDGYGAADDHYPQMSIEELCDERFAALAFNDAVLFMWATSPFLEDCFNVVRAWGFEYKTSFVWDKVKHNYGHYNSVRHEMLLICTKGSCVPDVPTLVDSVQVIERSDKHSEKPEEFRAIIDTLYPYRDDGRIDRIELFARVQHPHWERFGNEVVVA